MPDHNEFTNKEIKLAEAVFTALSTLDSVEVSRATGGYPNYDMSTLYTYVTNPDIPIPLNLQQTFRKEHKLRNAFHRLLEKTSQHHFPRVAAASSGDITEREIGNFRIRLCPSRVQQDQAYLIIELLVANMTAPKSLFIYTESGDCQKHILPPPQEDKIQLLIQADSELANGVRNHKSEIFLQ